MFSVRGPIPLTFAPAIRAAERVSWLPEIALAFTLLSQCDPKYRANVLGRAYLVYLTKLT